MHIEKDLHKIKPKNRYKVVTKKTQIIIGFSQRKDDFHINRLRHKDYGNTKKWNTYSITRDGDIYEHYDPKFYSDFMGIKEVDKSSISIVIENMGSLLKSPEGDYVNWINEKCPKKLVGEKKWLGQQYWEIFPEKQIENTIELCKKLCDDFNIQYHAIEFHYPHKDMKKFNGVVLKSNYFEDSSSVNPLFDLIKFNELLMLKE